MKTILILGVALIVVGAAVLGYDHYSYTTKENILQIGPIAATAERTVFATVRTGARTTLVATDNGPEGPSCSVC